MPKNSFLIQDILENSKEEYRGFKKRALVVQQQQQEIIQPSLSPASFVSTGSSSSSVDSNSVDMDLLKHQYISQAYPALLLNQYLMQSGCPVNEESIQSLLAAYYTKLFASNQTQHLTTPTHDSKRIKLENTNNNNNINSSKTESIENVSPLDALLQLANRSGLITNKLSVANNTTQDQIKQTKYLINKQQDSDLENNKKPVVSRSSTSANSSFDSLNENTNNNTKVKSNINNSNVQNALLVNSALKRKRKNRTAFTANQIFELEKRFSTQRYLSPHDRDRIAYELQLTTAQVITWFQNRRAKQKRDLEELKNDVNAAKNLKVIDPDLDVEKIIQKKYSVAGSSCSHSNKNSDCEEDENENYEEEDVDVEEEINLDNENNNESHSSSSLNTNDLLNQSADDSKITSSNY